MERDNLQTFCKLELVIVIQSVTNLESFNNFVATQYYLSFKTHFNFVDKILFVKLINASLESETFTSSAHVPMDDLCA